MQAAIKAISYYLPPQTLTNAELSREFPGGGVEKIAAKTGILERRISDRDTCSSDLGVESARRLFAEHGITPDTIDFVLFCTQSPDYFLPSTACLVQDRLGIPQTAGALDFNLGSSGFVYGLSLARGLIETGEAQHVLLITADTYSKFLAPGDKSVRTIFGDAAAATLVSASATGGLGPFVFGTDGRGADNLIVKTGGMRVRQPVPAASQVTDEFGNVRDDNFLYMNGPELLNFTLRVVPPLVSALLAKSGLTIDQIDLFVFHQPNKYLLETLRKKIKIPPERFCEHYSHCGNTVSATIPIALYHARQQGRMGAGRRLLLAGFGGGYSWAGCLVTM